MTKQDIQNLLLEAYNLLKKETGWMHMPSCPGFGKDGDKSKCNCSKAKIFLERPDVLKALGRK